METTEKIQSIDKKSYKIIEGLTEVEGRFIREIKETREHSAKYIFLGTEDYYIVDKDDTKIEGDKVIHSKFSSSKMITIPIKEIKSLEKIFNEIGEL